MGNGITHECFKNSEHHTAENLRDKLLHVTREWKLEGKIVAVCTDNAAILLLL